MAKIADFPLILPCGGKSERMGVLKGLLEYQGQSWLCWQMEQCHAAGLSKIVLVLGYRVKSYEAVLQHWSKPCTLQLSVVHNPKPEWGPFSSIMNGYRSLLPASHDAFFVLPIDVPCPNKNVWDGLVKALQPKIDVVVPYYEGLGGHPVLLSNTFLARLTNVSLEARDARLDLQIRELPKERITSLHVTDRKILFNLNTPEDFQKFLLANEFE